MSRLGKLSSGLLVMAFACSAADGPPLTSVNAHWFEGATLVVGDGRAPLENSAFLVEDGRFTWVGREAERRSPDGAVRVNLNGTTVIPALVDAHQHIGMTNITAGTTSQDNYTRDNIIDHLERSAYHGISATMSLGLEVDEALALGLRNEVLPNAARFLTLGRGIAATPVAGPQQPYRLGIPRGALTAAEGRAAVGELRANEIDLVKIWVDDRGGRFPRSSRRCTAPSSTRRTPAACASWHTSALRVLSKMPKTCSAPELMASRTPSATGTSTTST